MPSTLPLLIVSLLAANPQDAAPQRRAPTNAERAKMGLLPRRVAPSTPGGFERYSTASPLLRNLTP